MAVLATHVLCDSAFKRHWKSVYTIHQANRNRWDFNNARECEWNKKNKYTQQQQQNREREKESARVCMFVCLPVCMHTKVTGLKYCRKACGMIFSSRFQLCACVHISMEKCWIVEQLQYKATYACAYVLMIYVNKTHSHTRCSVCVHVCIFMCSIRVAVNEIMTKFFFGKDGTSMIFFLLFLKGWIFYYHRFIYFFMKILGECVFFLRRAGEHIRIDAEREKVKGRETHFVRYIECTLCLHTHSWLKSYCTQSKQLRS